MFAINLLGPKPVAKFQSLCVVFGLAPVALVLMFGWGSFDREVYDAAWNVSGESDAAVVFGSLAPVFWAFVDRKSVVSGKSVSVRVDLGGGRIIKQKKNHN